MKKIFSITAVLLLLSFVFVVSSDAFFCDENNQETTRTQASDHCCVQCCPSHNLASPIASNAQILSPNRVNAFIVESLDLPIEIHPNRIERPPIA